MNNPFEYIPDAECEAAFHKLVSRLETLKLSAHQEDIAFCRELDSGKMLGVLIASDAEGIRHTLYAFSGQIGERGFFYPGFVEPVFDYLRPDGYFKTKEREISFQNKDIRRFEEEVLGRKEEAYNDAKAEMESKIAVFKDKCHSAKLERDLKREQNPTEDELADMIRQSQFEKAELHRLKKRLKAELAPALTELTRAQSKLDAMKEKRRKDSESLQTWLFDNFRLLNALGESRSLSEIFAETTIRIPPSGAGECCAPKLLQAAYLRGLKPLSLAEYWYGQPKGGELRIHGRHYPACRGKCLPVLRWMLQGLDIVPPIDNEYGATVVEDPVILFENEWFCVIEKPSGMLSVPGRGISISLQQWLERRYGPGRQVKLAHRLDQDTSGLIVATFGNTSFKVMQSLFATRQVQKTYIADLEGDYVSDGIVREGRIDLPILADWLDRPRQKVDLKGGKAAITDYEFICVSEGRSRIKFHPLTGRTHQLRVHSASEQGLNMSIVGDRLYGRNMNSSNERLHLHSHKIEFTFPIDGQHYFFESRVPFHL